MKEKLSALPDNFKQLIKYGLVGVSNVLIYLGINYLLIENFNYFKNHLISASLIAGAISFVNGLYFNRKWTFKSKTHWVRDSIYILLIYGICTVIQNGVYAYMLINLKSTGNYSNNQVLYSSQITGVVVFAALNFTLNKYVTFRKKNEPTISIEHNQAH